MRQLAMVVAVAGMVWAGGSLGSDAGTPAQDIESAANVFFSEGHQSSRAAAQEALSNLADCASRIAIDANLPASAQELLAVAAASFADGGLLEPEIVVTVHRAYESVSGGRRFAFPEAVGSISEAKEHGRQQIQRCLAALEEGRPREAVQEILGFVLLVTTPMEKPE